MDVLIGVDEAGYGPNYGPLVVAATAWRVESSGEQGARSGELEGRGRKSDFGARAVASPPTASSGDVDLYKLLRKAVCRSPDKAGRKVAIADSKALYSPQAGIKQLERGVLAALGAMGAAALRAKPHSDAAAEDALPDAGDGQGSCVSRFAELLAATCADPERRRHELACHADDELALPLESLTEEITRLAMRLSEVCRAGGVTLVAIRARLVYPAEFNSLVEQWGSKGAALSHVTMGLVRTVVDHLAATDEPRPTSIFFDKHGGRSRYAALVQHHFFESWIETVAEHRSASRYRWTHDGAPVEAVFRVECEELLPTALASMAAKYHRELAMRAFNAFWAARVPGLRPTAGYPGDASRFRADIAAVQAELGIADGVLWRCR
jgi:hypothetical protein